MRVQSLDRKDPLEKGMATHSSILAWEIPWTEEPGRLQTIRSQRAGEMTAPTDITGNNYERNKGFISTQIMKKENGTILVPYVEHGDYSEDSFKIKELQSI